MKAHFIDLDIILKENTKVWVINKNKPNFPLLKIEKYQFNLFKSGIYRSHNNSLDFNGTKFWISNSFMNKLKEVCKRNNTDITTLAFSMSEFLNPEIIDDRKNDFDLSIFNKIINTDDHVYIICSKNTKKNYQHVIDKLEEEIKKIGLVIKHYYYVSETFYNKDDDEISYVKIKIIIQHLMGIKIEFDKFVNIKLDSYDVIEFYDDSISAIELSKNVNKVIEHFLTKTAIDVKLLVKEKIRNKESLLITNKWTHNTIDKMDVTMTPIVYSNVIKNFENFNFKNL